MRLLTPLLLALIVTPPCLGGLHKVIAIDGDFSDWDDVPALDSDPVDNVGSVDFAVTKIANDDNFLYVYNSFHTAHSMPVNLSIDTDSNVATGFNIYGLSLVGADASWQNDFPFTSGDGVFNNGLGMSGGLYGTGAAAITPFSSTATERELAISLDILFNEDGTEVFGAGEFTLLLWTEEAGGYSDVSAAIHYQIASIPEPAALLFGAVVVSGLSLSGQRRQSLLTDHGANDS